MLDEPAGEAHDPRMNHVHPDRIEKVEAALDGGEAGVVERAVLEALGALGEEVPVGLHRRDRDRSAREPGAPELFERLRGAR